MPTDSKTYSNLTSRNLDKLYFEKLTEKPSQAARVTKKETMQFSDYIEGDFAGMGYLQESYEGASFILDELHQGRTKTIYPTTRSLGFEYTEEALADDRYGIISKYPAELGASVAATDELIGFLPLNQAFAGPITTLDGQYLCSNTHADIFYGTTQDNLVSGALSAATLQEGLLLANNVKTSEGRPAIKRAKYLVVAANSNNYFLGKDLVKNEWMYNSNDRNLNPFMGEGLVLLPVDWLTTNTNWFLLSEDHDMRMFTRMETKLRKGTDPRNGNYFMYAKSRKTADVFNWQGVVGSVGA